MELQEFVHLGVNKTEFFILLVLSNEVCHTQRTHFSTMDLMKPTHYKIETVEKALRKLLKKGLIQCEGKQYKIKDALKLTQAQFQILKRLNEEKIGEITADGWRCILFALLEESCSITECAEKYKLNRKYLQEASEKMCDSQILEKTDQERFQLRSYWRNSALKAVLKACFLQSLLPQKYHCHDPMEEICRFHCDPISKDLEKPGEHNWELYRLLNWNDFGYYDIMQSFWGICKIGLRLPYADKKYNLDQIGKKEFVHRYVLHDEKVVGEWEKLTKAFPKLNVLIQRVYSISNMMPLPQNMNQYKGIGKCIIKDKKYEAHDQLSLFVELIELALNENECNLVKTNCRGAIVSKADKKELERWKAFLIENQVHLALEEEFGVKDGRLYGKKLFTNASLDYNFDKINKSDYEKMLDNIVSRMDKRADQLAEMIDAHAIKR